MIKPFRPYKTTHEWVNDTTGQVFSSDITLNLFDIDVWMRCNNEDQGFNDNVNRTEVITERNNSFYIRDSYSDFDNMMMMALNDNKMLDTRSLSKPEFNIEFYSSN